MTPKQAIYDYLGRPRDYDFDVNEYKGRYGGLINITGLKHKNIVVAGTPFYHQVCNYYDIYLDRWEFLYELGQWCAKYVREDIIRVGRQIITRGKLEWRPTRYFCVPAEALTKHEPANKEVVNGLTEVN